MKDILNTLSNVAGFYQGDGINHEGQPFKGTLSLQPLLAGRGFTISFTATGKDGIVYHKEESTIAPSINEKLTLWNFNTNLPGLVAHELRSTNAKSGTSKSFIFGFNQLNDINTFREEIALDLWDNGDLSYIYSWGMPGGEFKERSGVRMRSTSSDKANRPEFIKHYTEIQDPDNSCYKSSGSDELLSIGSPFAKQFGLNKLGIHHEVLPPGRRTSWPHAESDEEEFVYVIEGHPDAWVDGQIYRLNPGDGVGFPSGTGICHTFINNTDTNVRLLVVGEATKKENKCFYALHPQRNQEIKEKGFLWENSPKQTLGDHDGLPDKRREKS